MFNGGEFRPQERVSRKSPVMQTVWGICQKFFSDNDGLVVFHPVTTAAITTYTTNKTQFRVARFMYYTNMQRIAKEKVFQGDLFRNRNRKSAQKGPKYVASIFDSLAIKDF